MRMKSAPQYNINCVVPEPGDTADEIIQACRNDNAIRTVDGEEFCVELRGEVGPELWVEDSLRRSLRRHPLPMPHVEEPAVMHPNGIADLRYPSDPNEMPELGKF